jgi:hypothetical protein
LLSFTVVPGSESISFRVLLTEWLPAQGLYGQPGSVLFESEPLTAPFNLFSPIVFEVDLGGVALTPGEKYAWMLDAFSTYTGTVASASTALGGCGPVFPPPAGCDYTGGDMVSLPLGMPTGTRDEHFRMNWFRDPMAPRDLAFSLGFHDAQAVPEPANLPLVGVLMTALFGARALVRRRV